MANLKYLGADDIAPAEHHVTVVTHVDHMGMEKGYFFDSERGYYGGSGPFDWRMEEAFARAERYAQDNRISLIVVRSKRINP
ncbi:hypothetical protein [Mesorhizobium sp. B2-4-17]|uniref:hypothetical protein n=1 Tax=Mesorhizobium sp. B2-4-17 TaxID=2589932 RepID=UPI0011288790|nr:hypothetical protein [Mesorhizobium sp. B2-4-17]TPK82027.1 hypothetical protein FJ548_21430 [Mesorhizobium sp. B2-4-17]